jgi:hypothetical protein
MPPLRRLLPLLVVLATLPMPADAQSSRVPLSYDAPELDSIGRLDWRGGLDLSGGDDRFGGLSAIEVDEGGHSLTALTDRGRWIRLALEHDERGFLVAARVLDTALLDDLDGRPFRRPRDRDSEGLARLPDGSFVVAFESRHRLMIYAAAQPPFSRPPRWLNPPPGLYGGPDNGGIEALTAFAGDRLFALSEMFTLNDGSTLGWTGDGKHWSPLRYRAGTDFHPTGATLLPDGDVLILERRLSIVGGFAARLVRVSEAAILAAAADPGRPLEGDEIARLQAPLNVDNFEGVAATRAANGETIVYLVSDDNFFALQRTLLFAFALREEPPAAR